MMFNIAGAGSKTAKTIFERRISATLEVVKLLQSLEIATTEVQGFTFHS